MKLKVNKALLAWVTVEEFKEPLRLLYNMAKANKMVNVAVSLWTLFCATVIFNVVAYKDFAPVWMEWTADNITMNGALLILCAAMLSLPAVVVMKFNAGSDLKSSRRLVSKLENLVELFNEDVLIIDKTKIREFIGTHLRQQAFETRLFKPSSPDAKASQEKFNKMYDAAKAYGWTDEYKTYWHC